MDRIIVTCVIHCNSAEALRASVDLAKNKISLNQSFSKTINYFSAGVKRSRQLVARLGDYFDNIELTESEDDVSFTIVFEVRCGAESYWKDMAMILLRSINADLGDIKIKSLASS